MGRSAAERREDLIALYKQARGCTLCPLATGRTQVVFGSGNADADLMFIGEGPGMNEDQQGLPFVGRAGKLLDELLAEQGLRRKDVFISNVVRCRPPGNRDPEPEEIDACQPYTNAQVELIEPRVICTLGNFATKLLTRSSRGITQVRGRPQLHELAGRQVWIYPLFHPAAGLRTPRVKEQLREDFAGLPALLEKPLPAAEPAQRAPVPAPAEPVATPPAKQMGLFG